MIANVALPAFLPHSLATLSGIFVIAAIEGWFIRRFLGLTFAESYGHSLVANWKSTIVGIPLAWLLWISGLVPITLGLSAIGVKTHPAIESILFQSILTIGMPDEWADISSAAAWIVMLVPFWLGSVWIERRAIRLRLPDCDAAQLSKAVIQGNLASYSLFLICGIVALVSAVEELPKRKIYIKELREKQKQWASEYDSRRDRASRPKQSSVP